MAKSSAQAARIDASLRIVVLHGIERFLIEERTRELAASLEKQLKEMLETPNPKIDSAQLAWEKKMSSNSPDNCTALLPESFAAKSGSNLANFEDISLL